MVKITKIYPVWNKKHDFRVGAGSYFSGLDQFLAWNSFNSSTTDKFSQTIDKADTYITDRVFTGIYSFSYTYHTRRWFQYGATVSFGATTCQRRDNTTNQVVENGNLYAVSVMPTVRFVYMYRDMVQLYSSLSLGVVFGSNVPLPYADVTLLGCSVGKKLFGFAEFGAGMNGWGRIGIGYRFDAKKRK